MGGYPGERQILRLKLLNHTALKYINSILKTLVISCQIIVQQGNSLYLTEVSKAEKKINIIKNLQNSIIHASIRQADFIELLCESKLPQIVENALRIILNLHEGSKKPRNWSEMRIFLRRNRYFLCVLCIDRLGSEEHNTEEMQYTEAHFDMNQIRKYCNIGAGLCAAAVLHIYSDNFTVIPVSGNDGNTGEGEGEPY